MIGRVRTSVRGGPGRPLQTLDDVSISPAFIISICYIWSIRGRYNQWQPLLGRPGMLVAAHNGRTMCRVHIENTIPAPYRTEIAADWWVPTWLRNELPSQAQIKVTCLKKKRFLVEFSWNIIDEPIQYFTCFTYANLDTLLSY